MSELTERMKKILDMIAAMSVDCRMGGIMPGTYLSNLKAVMPMLEGEVKKNSTEVKEEG